MAFYTRRFHNPQQMSLFINGALSLGQVRPFYDLAGKTLTLSTPSGSCAFTAGADPRGLRLNEVNEQMGSAGVAAHFVELEGMLLLVENTPRYGIAFGAAAQTARTALGLKASGAISTSVIGPKGGGKVPSIVDICVSGHELTLMWSDDTSGSSAPASSDTSIADPSLAHTPISPPSRAIYIGTDGDLVVHKFRNPAGQYTTYLGLKAGDMLPIEVDEVRSDTTATNLVVEQN